MTQIKKLSDSELLNEAKKLVGDERSMLIRILHYLREIESRKLFLERGYSSLFSFCVGYLGYEESQAQRRISATRLIKEIPEIETKIENGCLSLTAVTQAQSFFRKETQNHKPMSSNQKIEVLSLLENKSTRQCEKELIKLSPDSLPGKLEKTKFLTETQSELKIVVKNETLEKLNKLKNLLSNKDPNMGIADLIDLLADEGLEKHDPQSHAAPKVTQKVAKSSTNRNRHIPAHLRREVWSRDQGRCTFSDPLTGKKCGSQFKLHIDHIVPWAAGGGHALENLRLYCAQHNNLAATHFYGKKKMAAFLRKESDPFK